MFVFQENFACRIVCVMAMSIFLASIFSQLLMDKEPCQLCLITRYLFLATGIATLLPKWRKILLPVVSFITLSFAFYHLGVENHWWRGFHGCVSELPSLNSTPMDTKTPPCDSVNWTVFGISSTLWAFLSAGFIFWISSTSYLISYYLSSCMKK